ncbi:16S rRNA (adenine(1518)-N(6)/adenine(1519)-N(6))-dimethyltransferase RsmA [Candidatus Uhrbacteria bacterium]|nr:16S rRNA (adenine(1518)-N(6)/adenine(1519)-N(6))-dimethyltransferase RsmA [Candidatus Uhrbacteria bacterium]
MTPTDIKAALKELGGAANKRLGQHFLIDAASLKTIVDTAAIRSGDTVLEVGPGLGALSQALLDQGAELVAIERDKRFLDYLNERLAAQRERSFRIVQGDAADVHWHTLIGDGAWKFVSNLPYAITSLALRKALWAPKPPDMAVVLVQREVAERASSVAGGVRSPQSVVRSRGKTSLLSLMVALATSSVRIVRRVPPGAFYPPPEVDSAVMQVVPMTMPDRMRRWGIDPEKVMQVAKIGFAHPRKMLGSNLKLYAAQMKEAGIPYETRAEDLSPDDWARLARSIHGA